MREGMSLKSISELHPSIYIIVYDELEKGLVQKKKFTDRNGKEFREYWIFKPKERKTHLYLPNSMKLQETDKTYLHSIIICDISESFHMVRKSPKGFAVRGIKVFGEVLKKYLSKTNRGTVD